MVREFPVYLSMQSKNDFFMNYCVMWLVEDRIDCSCSKVVHHDAPKLIQGVLFGSGVGQERICDIPKVVRLERISMITHVRDDEHLYSSLIL